MNSPAAVPAATAPPRWWHRLADHGEAAITWGGILAIAVWSFAGAFTHMYAWTNDRVPDQPDWMGWGNAVISEIMPMTSFLSLRRRQRQERPTGLPMLIFFGSILLSLAGNLHPVTGGYLGDKYLLAGLPAIALLVLSKMVFADLDYARKERERAAQLAARNAELAERKARRDAELAAELKARQDREAAELAAELAERERRAAAELAEREREHEAELARQRDEAQTERELALAKVQGETERRRVELEAAERDAARRAEEARLAEAERIRAEGQAEAARIAAEAEAERARAAAALLEAQAEAARKSAQVVADLRSTPSKASKAGDDGAVGGGQRRRTREETVALVNGVLAGLEAPVTRDQAVAAIVDANIGGARYARKLLEDWEPGQLLSSGPSEPAAALRLVAG